MRKPVRWVVVCLCFVWLAFVYASFYLVQQQRPVDGDNLRALSSTLLDLAAAGAILVLGAGLGHRLCRWLGVPFAHSGERVALSAGIGLGALSFLALGVGLVGLPRLWVMALLFGGLGIILLPDLVAVGRALADLRMVVRPPRVLSIYLGVTLALSLLVALAPPLDWDGLFYHLTMPRLYIEQGRIAPVTDIPHQHFPGLMEMLYLAAMVLKGDVAAKMLHFGYMLLLGSVVYMLAQRHVKPGCGWPSVVAYAAMPMVAILGSWAYNDLALAFYQIAALYVLCNWFETKKWPWLVLCAVFCGLAMGLKYTSFVCPLALGLFIAWHLARKGAATGVWLRTWALWSVVVLIVAAPWYLRNLAFTGNPVYPFAYGVFGGADWDEWRAAWYAKAGTGLGWNFSELLKLPWTLTLGIRDMNFADGRVGPLVLLSLPFLIAWAMRFIGRSRPRPPAMGYLLVFSLSQYAVWTVGVVSSRSLFQTRLLLPGLVALCAPMAYLFDELQVLSTRSFSLRRLVGMGVVLVLAANLCYQLLADHFYPAVLRIRPLPVLVGEESREGFLARNLGAYYAAMGLINERVPQGGRVLFLWEPRSYYCQRAVQPDPILERWDWLLHQYGQDPDAIAHVLEEEGYSHVLLHRTGLEAVREKRSDAMGEGGFAALDAFVAAYLNEAGRVGEAYVLYHFSAN